jgi:hypothetical protein
MSKNSKLRLLIYFPYGLPGTYDFMCYAKASESLNLSDKYLIILFTTFDKNGIIRLLSCSSSGWSFDLINESNS